ncbi:hypothetical protein KI688_003216 [Linnemannia hyalina]|uniref:Uncharacterized protein n=1 Tax=Linnemannia hyalina TaxID=64524 RepID=A0A9P7XPZ6_9FUNG|nr:hypothetical protein KI688_003216 [Linnemannia hyalina]
MAPQDDSGGQNEARNAVTLVQWNLESLICAVELGIFDLVRASAVELDVKPNPPLRLAQYLQVENKLSTIKSLEGTILEVQKQCRDNCLRFLEVEKACNRYKISSGTLFDGVDVNPVEANPVYKKDLGIINPLTAVQLLHCTCDYLTRVGQAAARFDPQLFVDAETLFRTRLEEFRAEIENERMLQEIRLETLKFENVNKRQLDNAVLLTCITAVGMAITAALSIASLATSKKCP